MTDNQKFRIPFTIDDFFYLELQVLFETWYFLQEHTNFDEPALQNDFQISIWQATWKRNFALHCQSINLSIVLNILFVLIALQT